jgi:hypothetical protein
MGADYTAGWVFVNWPVADLPTPVRPDGVYGFVWTAAIVRREKSF